MARLIYVLGVVGLVGWLLIGCGVRWALWPTVFVSVAVWALVLVETLRKEGA